MHGTKAEKPTLTHFNDRGTKAPNVGGPSVPRLLDDLGRHPGHRAADRLHALLDGPRAHARQLLGAAEVCQLGHARVGYEDVRSLDVSVYDALAVQVLHSRQNLERETSVTYTCTTKDGLENGRDEINMCIYTHLMSFSVNAPNWDIIPAMEPPVTYSNTMYKYRSVLEVPIYLLNKAKRKLE